MLLDTSVILGLNLADCVNCMQLYRLSVCCQIMKDKALINIQADTLPPLAPPETGGEFKPPSCFRRGWGWLVRIRRKGLFRAVESFIQISRCQDLFHIVPCLAERDTLYELFRLQVGIGFEPAVHIVSTGIVGSDDSDEIPVVAVDQLPQVLRP